MTTDPTPFAAPPPARPGVLVTVNVVLLPPLDGEDDPGALLSADLEALAYDAGDAVWRVMWEAALGGGSFRVEASGPDGRVLFGFAK